MFITFEGIEGSGKTTLMELLEGQLRAAGRDTLLTREPGGTDLGVAIRRALLEPRGGTIEPLAELMLFAADRAQHAATVIRPALEKGQVVLCDRFSDATVAYQGHGRGLPMDTVRTVDGAARGGLLPDMTVLLDLPVHAGLERVRARNEGSPDRAESRIDDEEAHFHERVRQGYLAMAGTEPGRFLVLDARKPPAALAGLVRKEIRKR
ncbi:MAG: dTMP kinase, partial [bacterium]